MSWMRVLQRGPPGHARCTAQVAFPMVRRARSYLAPSLDPARATGFPLQPPRRRPGENRHPEFTWAADFEFRVGHTNDPASWPLLDVNPGDITVALRSGGGSLGSDRVTILFPAGVIKNGWLQVTVKANATTGLAAPDVHYWGHMLGESGDVTGDTLVDSYDVAGVLANPHTAGDPAAITDVYDFNRDRLADAADAALAQTYATTPTTMLRMLNLRTAGLPAITISV